MQATGAALRYVRQHLGLTQRAFAAQLDITPEHLSNVENGNGKLSTSVAARLQELWNLDIYVLAWALSDPNSLPPSLRAPAKALRKYFNQILKANTADIPVPPETAGG
jgi:Helix-turn-helix.